MALPRSNLAGRRWLVPEIGKVELMEATHDLCAEIDAVWPPLRPERHVHHVWRWQGIHQQMRETFAVCGDAGPVAIWGSKLARVLRLPEGEFYRPDYLEIDPRRRGGVLGLFSLALMAARTFEVGAAGMVLSTFQVDGLVEFYEAAGATRGAPRGWSCPRLLVPLTFRSPVLEQLAMFADALSEEQDS